MSESTGILLLIWVGPNFNQVRLMKSSASELGLRTLANENTLLRTHCCRHKCLPACATFVADTNFVSGTQKMFLILFRNILCPQQMFPSLRGPRNIMGNNVSSFTRALGASLLELQQEPQNFAKRPLNGSV